MAAVIWSEQAGDDLEAIRRFIARDSEVIAARFVNRIIDSAERLRDFPRQGRKVPEKDHEDVREVFLASYRIIYQVIDDAVYVLTIHHGARLLDPDDLKHPAIAYGRSGDW